MKTLSINQKTERQNDKAVFNQSRELIYNGFEISLSVLAERRFWQDELRWLAELTDGAVEYKNGCWQSRQPKRSLIERIFYPFGGF